MKPAIRTVLLLALTLPLAACHPPRHLDLADVSEQMTQQFRAKQQTAHRVKSVEATGFSTPAGNPNPYLSIGVRYEGREGAKYTGVPMVRLGDGLFGVTFQDYDTKEEYSAVVSFR